MATKKPKLEDEEYQEEQVVEEPAPVSAVIPEGASEAGQVPPSLRGTSQDPTRKE
jgi:hypothetical protein